VGSSIVDIRVRHAASPFTSTILQTRSPQYHATLAQRPRRREAWPSGTAGRSRYGAGFSKGGWNRCDSCWSRASWTALGAPGGPSSPTGRPQTWLYGRRVPGSTRSGRAGFLQPAVPDPRSRRPAGARGSRASSSGAFLPWIVVRYERLYSGRMARIAPHGAPQSLRALVSPAAERLLSRRRPDAIGSTVPMPAGSPQRGVGVITCRSTRPASGTRAGAPCPPSFGAWGRRDRDLRRGGDRCTQLVK
jgi:hypothetical protein